MATQGERRVQQLAQSNFLGDQQVVEVYQRQVGVQWQAQCLEKAAGRNFCAYQAFITSRSDTGISDARDFQ